MDGLHELDIKWLQAGWDRKQTEGQRGTVNSLWNEGSLNALSKIQRTFTGKIYSVCKCVWQDPPVAKWGDEIEAAVNSIVNDVSTI